MKITLPQVDPKLHAHNKGHWRAKQTATKALRNEACLLARFAKDDGAAIERARVTYRFFVPDNRRRDTVNMMQACKPAIDGLVDAGVIVDDSWQHLTIERPIVEIDRKNPRVEIVIEEDKLQ